MEYSGVDQNNGEYQNLLKAYEILKGKNHPFFIKFAQDIEIDVKRSNFNNNDDKEKVNNLRNILKALVVRNVSINYCQTFRAIGEFFLKIANLMKSKHSIYFQCC